MCLSCLIVVQNEHVAHKVHRYQVTSGKTERQGVLNNEVGV